MSGYAPPGDTVALGEFLAVFRRRWVVLALCSVLGLAFGFAAARTAAVSYTAQATVAINPVTLTPFDSGVRVDQLVNPANEATVASSTSVAAIAARLLHDNDPRTLLHGLAVSIPPSSQQLSITYTAHSAKRAAAAANAFATAYLDYRGQLAEKQAQQIADGLRQRIAQTTAGIAAADRVVASQPPTAAAYQDALVNRQVLAQQAGTLRDQESQVAGLVITPGQVVNQALPPRSPSAPRHLLFYVAGLALGVIVGIFAALSRDRRDDRLRGDVVPVPGVATLAVVPVPARRRPSDRPAVLERSWDAEAEGYRVARAKLTAPAVRRGTRTLLAVDATGRATGAVAANLAAVLAQGGHRVALLPASAMPDAGLDAFRQSHGAATTDGHPSIARALSDPKRELPLVCLTGAAATASGLAARPVEETTDLLATLAEQADFVVVETAAERLGETLALATAVDGVVLAVARGRTSVGKLQALAEQLTDVGARLLGTVVLEPQHPRLRTLVQRMLANRPGAPVAVDVVAQPAPAEPTGVASR